MKTDDPSMRFTPDIHPDEDLLFLAIERELAPEEAHRVEEHLGACWSCRVRSEEMQKGISAFMEYREKRYAPMLPGPPKGYRNFVGQLSQASQESAIRESTLGRLKGLWNRLLRFSLPRRLTWASLVAVAMAMVLLYVQVINPPSLSADQLLMRAEAAQNEPGMADKSRGIRIVRQTVQITIDGQSTVKTFTWTTARMNPPAPWGGEQTWNAPLTAAGFAGWRRSLDQKTDTVRRIGGLWRLETIAPHHVIQEASLTMRAADFHPIEQRLRFRDDRELTVKELKFEIQEPVPSVRESDSKTDSPATTKETANPEPLAGNLDETELQLRYELFNHQWDLGEDLTITESSDNVVLSGTVSSQEREADLRASLGGLPNVRLDTTAPAAKTPSAQSSPSRSANPQPASAPLIASLLEKDFASREDQAAFVDESLAASDETVSHAWALKRLADRYDESQIRKLVPESRSKLLEMLHAHLRQLSQSNALLDRLLSLLPSGSGRPIAMPAGDWQSGVLELFAQVQRQDHAVTSLLAGMPRKTQELSAATTDFDSSHRSVNILLRTLDDIKLDSRERDR